MSARVHVRELVHVRLRDRCMYACVCVCKRVGAFLCVPVGELMDVCACVCMRVFLYIIIISFILVKTAAFCCTAVILSTTKQPG